MVLIDAIYIHESGGKTLLNLIIEELIRSKKSFFLLLDTRYSIPDQIELDASVFTKITPSEKTRKGFYKLYGHRFDCFFCMANVPPPVSIDAKVYILFHNVLLLSGFFEQNLFRLSRKVIFQCKRLYISFRNKKHYRWIVQTPSVKNKLSTALSVDKKNILIHPFFPEIGKGLKIDEQDKAPEFLYVASGVAQKNHSNLLDAWQILQDKHNVVPALHLTLSDDFSNLQSRILQMRQKGINILNHGNCSTIFLQELYSKCSFLVYPSLAESFGLPLIEAAAFGCKVIAADRPYVYDVVIPSDVFDPLNPNDIAEVIFNNYTFDNNGPTSRIVRNELQTLISLF